MKQTEIFNNRTIVERPSTGELEELFRGPNVEEIEAIAPERVQQFEDTQIALCRAIDLYDEFTSLDIMPINQKRLDQVVTDSARDTASFFIPSVNDKSDSDTDRSVIEAPFPPSFKDVNLLAEWHDALKSRHLNEATGYIDQALDYIFSLPNTPGLSEELQSAYLIDKMQKNSIGVVAIYKKIYGRFGREPEDIT